MSEEINNQNSENIENNENQQVEHNNISNDIKQKKMPLGKILAILAGIFVVVFLAVYFAVDMCMHRLGFTPFVVTMEQMEKLFDESDKYLEKASPAPVKIETDDDEYVVTIDLRGFDNNPDNINIETNENGIKINGQYKQNKNNEVKENSFYQNITFPNKIDTNKIEKKIKKDKIEIELPFKK